MSLKENGFLQSGAFQESKLEDDKKSIVDYYKSRGYVDASIDDVVRSYVKDPKTAKTWLILTIALKEGKEWLFGGISFEGNTIFTDRKARLLRERETGNDPQLQKLSRKRPRSTTSTTSPAISSTR